MTTWNQFLWNSGALWEPAVLPPPFPTNPQTKIKRMKRQAYYPSRVEAQPEWLNNFADKLPTYAATLGIANARRDAAVADALWLAYVLGAWIPDVRAWSGSCTDAANEAQNGSGSSVLTLPVFTAPALPAGVVPVAPGALNRIFTLVKDIKNAAGFTEAIGSDLRVIGTADTTENPVPRFTLLVEQGPTCQCVRIRFNKYGRTGVHIESRRNAGAWEFLGVDTESPYIDARPLLNPAQAEIREYRLRYWDKGEPTGDWTAVQKVTVAP